MLSPCAAAKTKGRKNWFKYITCSSIPSIPATHGHPSEGCPWVAVHGEGMEDLSWTRDLHKYYTLVSSYNMIGVIPRCTDFLLFEFLILQKQRQHTITTTSRQTPRRTAPPTAAGTTIMISSNESDPASSTSVLGDSVVVFTVVWMSPVMVRVDSSMGDDVLGSSHSLSL
jgi:hypothetical protein